MFGLGANEIFLILLFGFLIFGPDKLPKIAKTVGQAISKFRDAQNEMNNVIKEEVYDPDDKSEPVKNPLDSLNKLGNQETKNEKAESFTERKARYDRERAERKKAEERRKQAADSAAAASAAARRAMKKDEAERTKRNAASSTKPASASTKPQSQSSTSRSAKSATSASKTTASSASATSKAKASTSTTKSATAAASVRPLTGANASAHSNDVDIDALYGVAKKPSASAKKPSAAKTPATSEKKGE